jgi:WD40 repeat protein
LKLVNMFKAHKKQIQCMCFHQGLLFTGSHDKTIMVWRIPSMKPITTLKGFKNIQFNSIMSHIFFFFTWKKDTPKLWAASLHAILTSLAQQIRTSECGRKIQVRVEILWIEKRQRLTQINKQPRAKISNA